MSAPNGTDTLLGKVLSEVLIGRIRLHAHQPEPRYLQPMREFLLQVKRKLGDENFSKLATDFRPAMHALGDLLLDAVTMTALPTTVEKLKKLPAGQRLAVENVAAEMTGRSANRHREERWMDELWELKNYLMRISATSVSGITQEEIREGLDPLLHATIDSLCDSPRAFV